MLFNALRVHDFEMLYFSPKFLVSQKMDRTSGLVRAFLNQCPEEPTGLVVDIWVASEQSIDTNAAKSA